MTGAWSSLLNFSKKFGTRTSDINGSCFCLLCLAKTFLDITGYHNM